MGALLFNILLSFIAVNVSFASKPGQPKSAIADLAKAPHNFDVNSKHFVFTDFKEVNAQIVMDLDKKEFRAKSYIIFNTTEKGFPLFDLVDKVISAEVDGAAVITAQVDLPTKISQMQFVDKELAAGEHILRIEHVITQNVLFDDKGGRLATWMSDADDRQFMEQYLPSSLEYDQYRLQLDLIIKGSHVGEYDIFSNGYMDKIADNHYYLEFSPLFTTSSFYFHVAPKGDFTVVRDSYKSSRGREVPITVYGRYDASELQKFVDGVKKLLPELETDYGPWRHKQVVVYAVPNYGMEHCGATITQLDALDHEITHSYFGRGLMPANGNAGWIDEAINTWRDEGYPRESVIAFESSDMGAHSEYQRFFDQRAYFMGAHVFAHLDYLLAAQGGLKPVLSKIYMSQSMNPYSEREFNNWLNTTSGMNFDAIFDRYSRTAALANSNSQTLPAHKKHHAYPSKADRLKLL